MQIIIGIWLYLTSEILEKSGEFQNVFDKLNDSW